MHAPCSIVTSSGRAKTFPAGTANCSAMAPLSRLKPSTRSPTVTWPTSSPTASTRPAASGAGNEGQLGPVLVEAPDHQDVGKVQTDRFHADQHFARSRYGRVCILVTESLERSELVDHVGLHVFSSVVAGYLLSAAQYRNIGFPARARIRGR